MSISIEIRFASSREEETQYEIGGPGQVDTLEQAQREAQEVADLQGRAVDLLVLQDGEWVESGRFDPAAASPGA